MPAGYDPAGRCRFSEKIMLEQGDEIMMLVRLIAS